MPIQIIKAHHYDEVAAQASVICKHRMSDACPDTQTMNMLPDEEFLGWQSRTRKQGFTQKSSVFDL